MCVLGLINRQRNNRTCFLSRVIKITSHACASQCCLMAASSPNVNRLLRVSFSHAAYCFTAVSTPASLHSLQHPPHGQDRGIGRNPPNSGRPKSNIFQVRVCFEVRQWLQSNMMQHKRQDARYAGVKICHITKPKS